MAFIRNSPQWKILTAIAFSLIMRHFETNGVSANLSQTRES